MRPIKYRGQRLDNGQWVEGLLTQYKGNIYITIEIIEPPTLGDPGGAWIYKEHEVNLSTVGQFLEKPDMQGNQVFEHDIVRGECENCYVIKFGQFHYCDFCFYLEDRLGQKYYLRAMEAFTKVGNIHDNPELL